MLRSVQQRWPGMWALALFGLLVGIQPAAAGSIIETYASDADFLANANFTKLGGANVRWGDGAANGDWEFSVVNANDIPTGTGNPQQFDWNETTTNPHRPLVDYGSNGVVGLILQGFGGVPPNSGGTIGTGANALYIRARANTSDGRVATLSDIKVTFLIDNAMETLGPLTGDGDAQYVGIIDDRLASGFSVAASANLGIGANFNGSDPAYQFKIGTVPIAAPASLALIVPGLVMLERLSRRRSA